MTWRGKRAGRVPVPMMERWVKAYRTGEVPLEAFTPAELDCVALDPEYLPAEVRGPALQTVTPLLAELEAERRGSGDEPGAAEPGGAEATGAEATGAESTGMARLAGGDPALADAAAGLELLGYIRPGEPAPADGPVPAELAGWSVNQAGQQAGVRRVAISGDLGIVTRMRAQPFWVVEVSVSPEPGRPDLMADWPPTGRMYASYRPLGALAERPAGPDGSIPPFALLGEERTLQVMLAWCGAYKTRPGKGQPEAGPGSQPAETPTSEVAAQFTSLAQLRVARSYQQQVQLSLLVVASGQGRYWLLEGERAERAVQVPAAGLASQVIALLKSDGEESGPAGQDARAPGEEGR
jgi:hypothetical protein